MPTPHRNSLLKNLKNWTGVSYATPSTLSLFSFIHSFFIFFFCSLSLSLSLFFFFPSPLSLSLYISLFSFWSFCRFNQGALGCGIDARNFLLVLSVVPVVDEPARVGNDPRNVTPCPT